MEVRLNSPGEGVERATVSRLLVKPGETVKKGQLIIEVDTDKATVPVESPADGMVERIAVKEGEVVPVGQLLLTLTSSTGGSASSASAASAASAAAKAPAKQPAPAPAAAARPVSSAAATSNTTTAAAPTTSGQRLDFALPSPGEGVMSARVANVLVKAGDTVKKGQTLAEVETDKATAPVDAPADAKVLEVRIKPGDEVKVGAVILVLELLAATAKPTAPAAGATAAATAAAASSASPAAAPASLPAALMRRSESVAAPNGETAHRPAPAPAPTLAPGATPAPAETLPSDERIPVPAGPATRRLARELGVDLRRVKGTGRGGRVTIEDVKLYVKTTLAQPAAAPLGVGLPAGVPALPDFSRFGEIERKPVSNLRRKIAENLAISWLTCPMVTQYDHADITELEAGRKRFVESQGKAAPKVTMTILAMKAVVAALRAFPQFNASFDAANGELILKRYFHLGIAVDTERGLVVPIIRDVDKKSIQQLAREVAETAERARAGKLTPDDMPKGGGSFTISNLGGVGGTAFSPIINYPEVAILGMARSELVPRVVDGQIVPRLMLPLCLTYDHRVIDGADGARFTAFLARIFSDPVRLLLEA
jgi:pyruvate dehydrogenase E2 component (dihydrolipoamide acetyltransferase)